MLLIRKKQMEVLSKYMVKQFENRMIDHLRSHFPEYTQNKPESFLRNVIRSGIDKASTYGVKRESDVQTFLKYTIIYGDDFDTSPKLGWVGKILTDKSLNPGEKMYALDRLLKSRGLK